MTTLHAVSNPPEGTNQTKELVKTVILTSAISSLVGVFAVAGGQALLNVLKRDKKKKNAPDQARPVQPPPPPASNYDEEDDRWMPESLTMQPNLRPTGRRRRRSATGGPDSFVAFQQALSDFERRQDERFSQLQNRVDRLGEELEEDEDE